MFETLQFGRIDREHFVVNGSMTQASILPHTIRNRAFNYADGFFETIRISHGRLQNLELHYSRISDSFEGHKMNVPQNFNSISFEASLTELIQKKNIQQGGRVRVTFFRDGGGRYTPTSNDVWWVAEAESIDANEFQLNEEGLVVDIYPEMKKTRTPLANFKNLAAQIYVHSGIWAREQELSEALISNERNHIIESTKSNLFLVSNRVLYTPGLDGGPVGGIMRAAVIQVALSHGYKVYECDLTPQELLRADEMFLTNAIRGIQWVTAYRTKRYFSSTAKELVELLNQALVR
ncbi:MAG: aminotransferase class IV [Flavobacteriales bacterium]